MALVVEAEHIVVACVVLHTAVEVVGVAVAAVPAAAAVAPAVAVAVGEPATVEAEGLVAACCDAVLVQVEIECPLRGSIHSIPALLPWTGHKRWLHPRQQWQCGPMFSATPRLQSKPKQSLENLAYQRWRRLASPRLLPASQDCLCHFGCAPLSNPRRKRCSVRRVS